MVGVGGSNPLVPTIRFYGEIQACLKQANGFRRFYLYAHTRPFVGVATDTGS